MQAVATLLRRGMSTIVLVAIAAACSAGTFPRDPNDTLRHVVGGVMRVGVGERMPWAGWEGDRPAGAEVELVQQIAGRLHARIEWTRGSDEELLHALEEDALDVVAAGLESDSPWKSKVSFSHALLETHSVLAVPPGVGLPSRLRGATVAAAPGSADRALLRELGARVVSGDRHDVPEMVEEWELGSHLLPTGIEVERIEHVLALPLGENAWLLQVNRLVAHDKPRLLRDLRHTEEAQAAGRMHGEGAEANG